MTTAGDSLPVFLLFCNDSIEKATKEQMVEGFVQIVTSLKNSLNEYLYAGRDVYIAVQKQAKENCDLVLSTSK